jgi:hypothetical protein
MQYNVLEVKQQLGEIIRQTYTTGEPIVMIKIFVTTQVYRLKAED